jgi:hypothetical protein
MKSRVILWIRRLSGRGKRRTELLQVAARRAGACEPAHQRGHSGVAELAERLGGQDGGMRPRRIHHRGGECMR